MGQQQPRRLSLVGHLLHWVLGLAGAAVLFVAYQHLQINGAAVPAYTCLCGAALLALSPLKALLHAVFCMRRGAMHLAHLVAGLGLVALPVSGVVFGTPVLTHAALAPFAMMGAAQALTHFNKPRDAAQARAIRSFVHSLPEVAQFSSSRDFASPATVKRAATVLGDLISKVQALGETELTADPGFQSALKQVGMRTGLGLSLDVISHSIDVMGRSPAAAAAAPALRARLAQVRRSMAKAARESRS
ncbi:MAG: hypothetical protein ACREU2_04550 [Steroidobacteraceae bacterium]